MTQDLTLQMKFRGHETFFIRKGWLSKGLRAVCETPDVFVSKENPMDRLGLGSNMVKSLRYWLQAVRLTSEEKTKGHKRTQTLTDLGNLVFANDRYFDEIGTLWALHYELVNNCELATSWYYFFNEFRMKSFSQSEFTRLLTAWAQEMSGSVPAPRSLSDDFNCILGTYISRDKLQSGKVSPENNIDCPLGELELVDVDNAKEKTFRKRQANLELLPPLIGLYALLSFAGANAGTARGKEVSLDDILNCPASPGKAFNLDSFSVLDLMRKLEASGYIHVIRTAGLDQVRIDTDMTSLECLEAHYREIG